MPEIASSLVSPPVASLPPFAGLTLAQIHVPATVAACETAAQTLLQAGVVGFDTETRPVFTKGVNAGGPHLVQFATLDAAYLFQLHHPAASPVVCALLQDAGLLKVGFGLREDRRQIAARLGIEAESLLDLSSRFRQQGMRRDVGVVTAVAMVLQQAFQKSKRISTSNWAAERLRPNQLLYAANDAYAALMVHRALDK